MGVLGRVFRSLFLNLSSFAVVPLDVHGVERVGTLINVLSNLYVQDVLLFLIVDGEIEQNQLSGP
jgi:hypothetical protein